MSARNSNQGSGQAGQQNEQAAIGLGGPTSGEEGSTPTHETMAETGGSGGRQMTQPRPEEEAPLARGNRQGSVEADDETGYEAEGADTAATAIARGFQDTRSRQASPGNTGLGTPETGGNQSEADLAPPRKP